MLRFIGRLDLLRWFLFSRVLISGVIILSAINMECVVIFSISTRNRERGRKSASHKSATMGILYLAYQKSH